MTWWNSRCICLKSWPLNHWQTQSFGEGFREYTGNQLHGRLEWKTPNLSTSFPLKCLCIRNLPARHVWPEVKIPTVTNLIIEAAQLRRKKKRNTMDHKIDCGCLILPMSNMARSSLGVPPRSSRAPRLNSVAPWHRAAPDRRRWEALWATGGFWRSWESWAARQHKATLWKWHKVVAHGELSIESLGFRLIVTLGRV